MKAQKVVLLLIVLAFFAAGTWLGVLYLTYGKQTLLFLVQSPPENLISYSKNIISAPSTDDHENLIPLGDGSQELEPTSPPMEIPTSHTIPGMSHTYQKLNNCGPSSASMAASVLGVTFDQFVAADVLKGGPKDKNVAPDEMLRFLQSKGLKAILRVNGKASQMEQFVAKDIPVIAEQWLVKRGSGELVGHYRVVKAYDQNKKIFTTSDSFNGPNFVIPYGQFDEWWRPFNRSYIVVYRADQEELVKQILGHDWTETRNWQGALAVAQNETQTIKDGYSYFNAGSSAVGLKDYQKAKTAYDEALTKPFPEHFLWYQFGPLETYSEVGEYDKVFKLTDEILKSAGEVEEARYYRGVVYEKQGKLAEAKSEYEKSLAANPRYLPAQEALSKLN